MFQRRMLIVASRLQNTQLHAPKLFSFTKKEQQQQQQGSAQEQQQNNVEEGMSNLNQRGGSGNRNNHGRRGGGDFETLAMSLRNRTRRKDRRQSFLHKLRQNMIYVAFLLYLLTGILFYRYDPGNEVRGILAYYQAITIGFSVGLGTKNPDFTPNVWFSSVFILCGAAIIAVMLTQTGNQVEESASMSMFESLQRRSNYEEKMSRDNPWHVRAHAFLAYNAAYLITIFIWILWMGFIMVWSMLEVPEWDFGEAQYFAISLCSSAGSFSLPTSSSDRAYGLAGLSMMVGVPLMAMGVSSVIIMVWQGHRFKVVKEAAWKDVTQEELGLLRQLELLNIEEGEKLTKGGFILLGLLRMGSDVGVIKYLADAHDTIDERGGVIIRTTSAGDGEEVLSGYYSAQAKQLVERDNEEIETMRDFIKSNKLISSTTASSGAASYTSKPSTCNTGGSSPSSKTISQAERSWSTAVRDSCSLRHFSGLSDGLGELGSGGSQGDEHLDTIEESVTTHGESLTSTTKEKIESLLSPPARLDSNLADNIPKREDSWQSNG